jgi:predicted nuclease with RNAse H fold
MDLIGFDPGGKGAFGWAVLAVDASGQCLGLRCGVESTAPDAIDRAQAALSSAPTGVGIDAPLYWVERGDREVDRHIRRRVLDAGGSAGTVSAINSLQGACVAQGIICARLARASWSSALITEAHPKALLRIHPEAGKFVDRWVPGSVSTHERDAALAAYAAWQGARGNASWRNMICMDLKPFFPAGSEVSYWFPA